MNYKQMPTSCRSLLLFCATLLLIAPLRSADTPSFAVDFQNRSKACPGTVTAKTDYSMHVTGINDIVRDFSTSMTASYRVETKRIQILYPGDLLPGKEAGQKIAAADCDKRADALMGRVKQIQDKLNADPDVNPNAKSPIKVPPVSQSIAALQKYQPELTKIKEEFEAIADNCTDYAKIKDHPFYKWLQKALGDHSTDFKVTVEPDADYEFTIVESWNSFVTAKFKWHCGDNDKLSISTGALFTWTPYRTYDHSKTPVPPGSSNVLDTLAVSGNGTPKPLGTGLVNIKIPLPQSFPSWTGLMFSSGPVFTLGDAPKVSSFGWFAGVSVHLYGAVYLTPGFHFGEFADFPNGFYTNATIPDKFGDLTPLKRSTTHFAIGLTYRVHSFSKSKDNAGGAAQSPAAEAKQQTKGNAGSGK